MGKLLNLLRNRATGGVLVMLVIIAAILLLGRQFHLSLVIQLAAIIAVLLIGMVVLAVQFVKANKGSSAIEQSIRRQAEQQAQSVRPDKQAEIKQLQEELDRAITRLKQSKLGGGRRGRAALYALPWYMMIGPPAAGKTTAIANSGLNFPIGLDAIRGVGGTRNCDWFFSDSAIILDTAGRYMTEPEDEEEWNAFLETLRTNRRKQPINGVIVAISMDELADASLDQIDLHATTIRRKIDDLVTRLNVKFPVYLLFTKCDLLRGFVQFFGELGRQERDQIWGCTLDRNRALKEDVRALFEKEFDRLFQHLVNMRSSRLARAMKREDRQLVYVFPLEFASVRDKLSGFIDRLFQSNPYQESPTFRGFYFSSGTQEGVPIDRVIRTIAEKFGFSGAALPDAEPVTQTKSYFIKDLFTRVVIPDRFLVSKTSSAAVKGRFVKAGVGVGAVVLLVLFILGAGQALVRSQIRLNRVLTVSREASPVQASSATLSGDDLTRLDQLRSVVVDLDDVPLLGWGLDRRSEVREPVRKMFFGKMRQVVGSGPFTLLERRTQRTLQDARLDESQKEQLYDDFKAYLLMTREVEQLKDDANMVFLKKQLVGLSDSISSRNSSSAAANEAQAKMHELLEAYVEGLRAGYAQPFEPNPRLVARTERVISEPISADRLYVRIKRSGEQTLGMFSLYSDVLEGLNVNLFALDAQIPAIFTLDGWETFVQGRIDTDSENPNRDDWVVTSRPQSTATASSTDEVRDRMTSLYMGEYGEVWQAFLTNIEYQAMGDVAEAARRLTSLGDPDRSPILYVLAKASHNTFASGSLLDQASEQIGTDEGSGNPVARRFKALHELNAAGAATGTADASLIQALSVLGRLGETLESFKSDGPRIAEFAADVIEQRGGELASARDQIRSSLPNLHPSIRDNLFDRPIVLTWQAVLNSTKQYLNERWRDEVYEEFQSNLAGRYPVDQTSISDDVPIDDFERFFRPIRGSMSGFYAQVLAPFLRDDMSTPKTWLNRGISVSREASDALNKAVRIGEGLFEGETLRLTFELTPEQPIRAPGAPPASQYFIDVHGQTSSYTMGTPVSSTINWPGSPAARLRVSTQEGDLDPIQYDGHWAWFKLLRAADLSRLSSTQYEVRWDVGRGVVARYRVSTRRATNPFAETRDFFEIEVPATLDS